MVIKYHWRHDGNKIHPWYRISYLDYSLNRAVIAPIGIHLIVRLVHRIWEWSWMYKYSKHEIMIDSASREMYNKGWKSGYREGIKAGADKTLNVLKERIALYGR